MVNGTGDEHVDLGGRGGRDGISAALDGIQGPASNYALLMQYSIFYTYRLNQPTNYIGTDSISNIHNQPTILKYGNAPTDST